MDAIEVTITKYINIVDKRLLFTNKSNIGRQKLGISRTINIVGKSIALTNQIKINWQNLYLLTMTLNTVDKRLSLNWHNLHL